MQIYDGRRDRPVPETTHTVAVVSASRRRSPDYDSMTLRKDGRRDGSLFFCEAGCLYVEDELLRPGQLWIYPPEVPHKYVTYHRDQTVYWYLHFTGSDVAALMDALEIGLMRPLDVSSRSTLALLGQIRESMQHDDAVSRLCAEYRTLALLELLAPAKIAAEKTPSGGDIGNMMQRAMDMMEHSFGDEYDAGQYAAMFHMSVSRFVHLFRETCGVSPYAYCIRIRMANARAMLEETELKIREIAERCGYRDALYFTQAFRRNTGMTPSEYRRVRRQGFRVTEQ